MNDYDFNDHAKAAQDCIEQIERIGQSPHGSWQAQHGLALTSIAHSLARIAEQDDHGNDGLHLDGPLINARQTSLYYRCGNVCPDSYGNIDCDREQGHIGAHAEIIDGIVQVMWR